MNRILGRHPHLRHTTAAVLILIVCLVVLRLALPSLVEREINSRLAAMGDYNGRVEHVDLALWRGNYTLQNLTITLRDGDVPVPLLDAPRVAISLSWRNLLRGGIVAEVLFERPVVHFVDGKGESDSQSGMGVDWRQHLESLIPIRLDEVNIRDATLVFHNFVTEPKVDLTATQVNANIYNLTNVRDEEGQRVAELQARAVIFESGRMETEASFDPFGSPDEFQFALRILGIDITQINELAQAYANLDFESGNGELVMELEAADGRITGYAKPLLQHIKIFSWEDDVEEEDKNPLEIAWEVIAENITNFFKNQPADQFGTRFEISGDINNPEISTFRAILGILRNAFIEAFQPYFEGTRLNPREQNK